MARIKNLEPIAATTAKINFGDILHQTSVNGKKFVVNRQGKPVAVILSYNDYCKLIEQAKEVKRGC
jgi:prevent-host-death family protein